MTKRSIEPLLTLAEAREYLRCSRSTMHRELRAGKLVADGAVRGRPRFRRETLDRYFAAGGSAANSAKGVGSDDG